LIGEFVAVPPCHDCVIAAFAEFLFLEAFLLARTAASSLNDIRDISCCNRALSKGSEKGGGSIRGMNLVLKIEEEETSFLFSDQGTEFHQPDLFFSVPRYSTYGSSEQGFFYSKNDHGAEVLLTHPLQHDNGNSPPCNKHFHGNRSLPFYPCFRLCSVMLRTALLGPSSSRAVKVYLDREASESSGGNPW